MRALFEGIRAYKYWSRTVSYRSDKNKKQGTREFGKEEFAIRLKSQE